MEGEGVDNPDSAAALDKAEPTGIARLPAMALESSLPATPSAAMQARARPLHNTHVPQLSRTTEPLLPTPREIMSAPAPNAVPAALGRSPGSVQQSRNSSASAPSTAQTALPYSERGIPISTLQSDAPTPEDKVHGI